MSSSVERKRVFSLCFSFRHRRGEKRGGGGWSILSIPGAQSVANSSICGAIMFHFSCSIFLRVKERGLVRKVLLLLPFVAGFAERGMKFFGQSHFFGGPSFRRYMLFAILLGIGVKRIHIFDK